MIWLRPGLSWSRMAGGSANAVPALDAAIFDVDGVLIDTSRSYLLAVIQGSERLVREVNGIADVPSPMVSPEDVARFKLAGGFNSDWDCTRLFAALWTARLREWRGRPEAAASIEEWAASASEAARAGRGGLAWLRATVPASAIPSAEDARWAHDEYYWGTSLCRELFGHEPRYVRDAPGFVHQEKLLLDGGLLPMLVGRGITRFGLITGRVGPEVTWALRAIAGLYRLPAGDDPPGDDPQTLPAATPPSAPDEPGTSASAVSTASTASTASRAREASRPPWHASDYGSSPFGAIVAATEVAKPDPRALSLALARLGAQGALYVGDTADDLDLVLRYRREVRAASPKAPPVLAVMIAEGPVAQIFQARGADLILSRVTELPEALEMVAGLAV